jgi:hypothetical protein
MRFVVGQAAVSLLCVLQFASATFHGCSTLIFILTLLFIRSTKWRNMGTFQKAVSLRKSGRSGQKSFFGGMEWKSFFFDRIHLVRVTDRQLGHLDVVMKLRLP